MFQAPSIANFYLSDRPLGRDQKQAVGPGYLSTACKDRSGTMQTFLKNFLHDESGASAAEYALILAIIGVGMAGAALALSIQIQGAMTDAAGEIEEGRGIEEG